MIVFEGVTKKYGGHAALENAKIKIEGGEFVCVIGPSGAGKSTFLHLLIGAEKPDEGSFLVDCFDVSKMSE